MVVAPSGSSAGSSSMAIKGSLDTTEIESGFSRVGRGFKNVAGQAKSFGSDMTRVAIGISSLTKRLITLGTIGVTAMVGIASKSPAVAPAMAKMGVTFDKLTRSLGQSLAPAFEKVAVLFDQFATWVGNNKQAIGDMALKFIDVGIAVGEKLWPYLKKVGDWAVEHPGLFVGIVSGLALSSTVLAGISSISGLISLMTGTTISAGLLSALGIVAGIGVAAYAANEYVLPAVKSNIESYTGQTKRGMNLDTSVKRGIAEFKEDAFGIDAGFSPDEEWEMLDIRKQIKRDIANGNLVGGQNLSIGPAEDRRGWFMQWWDATWG